MLSWPHGRAGEGETGKERRKEERKEEGYIKFKTGPGFNNNLIKGVG